MPGKGAKGGERGVFGRIWERFGEVAERLGLVHEQDVREALEEQERALPRKKIGETLVDRGKLTPDHVETVLKEQKADRAKPSPAKPKAAKRPAKKAKKKAKKK